MDPDASSSTYTSLPNFIYVSELLRTWETAVLLFLSLLNTFLTLFISPFLRESGPIDFPSDKPGELKEQVKEFVRFIALLRELKKSNIVGMSNLIPEKFTITLKHFGGKFTGDFKNDIEKPEGVTLEIVDGGIQIVCDFSENTGLPSHIDSSKRDTIQQMFEAIRVPTNLDYVPYSDTTPELLFPEASSVLNLGSMYKPSTPPGSLADFVDWYNKNLQQNPDSNDDIVTAVSHSGTMKNFVERVIETNSQPSQNFKKEYDIAIGTNTCSLLFKTGAGPTFNIFRHAYSCDNRNMHKGNNLERLGDSGIYASLSLWGILSTLKFSSDKMQSLITAQGIENPPGLKIRRGMDKESDTYLADTHDSMNVLCGEQRDRMPIGNFSLSLGHCGTMEGEWGVTLDKNCIRIITDPKGTKVVLYLDKKTNNVIQARFFKSAETSTKYDSFDFLNVDILNNILDKIIKHLFPKHLFPDNVNDILKLKKELIESIKLFINSDEVIKARWNNAFDKLYTGFQQSRILDETKCIKITANKDSDNFTLDLVDCARPTSEPGAEPNFALLFLDKDKHKIECKIFENNTTGITFSFEKGEHLGTYLFNILTGLGVDISLKSELIESIKTFIEKNTEIVPEWKELLTPLYQSYIDKKAAKAETEAETEAGVRDEHKSMFNILPTQRKVIQATAGGTNKRTRRHRKHKVMKKYTRKYKKYSSRRKTRRIQKRKQTHKRKLGKSRKSRKSRK